MANHVDVFEFCIFYVLCFSALLYITGFGSFPPRPLQFDIPEISLIGIHLFGPVSFSIAWLSFLVVMGGVGVILAISCVALSGMTITVLGTGIGWKFDGKYVATVGIGFIVAGGLGVSMTQMLPVDVPLIISFFLVWVWIIMLIYTIFMYAGAGGSVS